MRKMWILLLILSLWLRISQVAEAAPGITAGFLVPADTAVQVDRDIGLKGMELEFIRADGTLLEAGASELPVEIDEASVTITIIPEEGEIRTVECRSPECRGNLEPPPGQVGFALVDGEFPNNVEETLRIVYNDCFPPKATVQITVEEVRGNTGAVFNLSGSEWKFTTSTGECAIPTPTPTPTSTPTPTPTSEPIDTVPPDPITDLSVEETGHDWVEITWTAAGDDKQAGQAKTQLIRIAPTLKQLKEWEQATEIPNTLQPGIAGTRESFTITGLKGNSIIYIAIESADESGNVSEISNIVRAVTKVTRGWLGVNIQDVNQNIANAFGLDEVRGALVGDVMKDSSADKSGIQRADVIISFDKQSIDGSNTLKSIVAATEVGKRVPVVVIRNGKEKTIQVEIGEQPTEMQANATIPSEAAAKFGLHVQELTPEIANQLGYTGEEGVVVTSIDPGRPAAEAGLRRGDLIWEINRNPIGSLADYNNAMANVGNDESFLLLIRRGNKPLYVVINVERTIPTPTPKPPFIEHFRATPSRIKSGQPVTLNWQISNAQRVSISPGFPSLPATGIIRMTPSSTTTYMLRAKNITGEAEKRVTVRVDIPTPTPTPTSTPTPTPTVRPKVTETRPKIQPKAKPKVTEIRPKIQPKVKPKVTGIRPKIQPKVKPKVTEIRPKIQPKVTLEAQACLKIGNIEGNRPVTCEGSDGHCFGKAGCTFYDSDRIIILLRFKNLTRGTHEIVPRYRYGPNYRVSSSGKRRTFSNPTSEAWAMWFPAEYKEGGPYRVQIFLDRRLIDEVYYCVNCPLD